jgi:Repeat of unknown function (DUF5907)
MALYSYSTPNANAGQLHQEVADAGLPVEVVLTTATVADVYTTRALTAPEVTTLNGVVAAHVPGSYQANPGQGEKVKVSVDDTTAGYLAGKLVPGQGMTLTPSAPGVQTLTVATGAAIDVLDTDTLALHITPGGLLWGDTRQQMSLTSDAAGLKLAGDIATPGGSMLYGTDAGGTRGWHAQPAGGGGGGELTDGDKVDITVSSGGTIWTIDPGAVTYAKIQDVTANRLLGRSSGAAGPPQEVSLGYGMTMTGTTLKVALGYFTAVKAATEAVTGTGFVTLTDPALTMAAGVYEVWYEASLAVAPSTAANGVKLRLYNDTAAAVVPDTERAAISEAGGNFQLTLRASAFVNPTDSATFRLQACKAGTSAGTYQVISDANAKTVLGYRRIQ